MEDNYVYVVTENRKGFDCWGDTKYSEKFYGYYRDEEEAEYCARRLPHGGEVYKVRRK